MDPGRQQLEIDLNDNNSAYTLITTDSSLETKSNLPGPGRNLGNLYSCLGKKFENILSAIAVWVGRGPRQTATKMRVLVQEDGPRKPSYNRKLERLGERLVKYARSDAISTQDIALSEVINLAFENEQLRLLLKSCGFRSIGLLQQNYSVWYNMPKQVQSRARKALVSLADETASVKDLVCALETCPRRVWPQIRMKLRACLGHENYSFVAVRHLGRIEIANSYLLFEVVGLLISCLNQSVDFLEWPECDKVLTTRLAAYVQHSNNPGWGLKTLSQNSLRLPKTFSSHSIQDLIAGLDSNDIDIVVWSYTSLSPLAESRNPADVGSQACDSEPNADKLRDRLASTAGRALVVICRNARVRFSHDTGALIGACRTLAELIENENDSVRQQAQRNARIALCVNRYIRQEMVNVLSSTALGRLLVVETEALCKPSDCPIRGKPDEVCKLHGAHQGSFFRRHCDANGNLIHIDNSFARCEGECGATEQHIMKYDENDVMRIEVTRKRKSAMINYHPIVAGTLSDGRRSYIFDLDKDDGTSYLGSGSTPRETRFLQRSNGNLMPTDPSSSDRLYVWVLRYNPDSYMYSNYYVNKLRPEITGLNQTGPFSWKFLDHLPASYQ